MKRTTALIAAALTLATAATGSVQAGDDDDRDDDRRHGGHAEWRGDDDDDRGRRTGRMLRQLQEFDLNGDGAITQAEIEQSRQERIARFDANGDGMLALEEYQALWLDARRERMVDAFQAHDDDGDGQVTAGEFNERFDGLVERFDRNGDGELSEEDRFGPRRERRTDAPVPPAGDTVPGGTAPGIAPGNPAAGTGSQ